MSVMDYAYRQRISSKKKGKKKKKIKDVPTITSEWIREVDMFASHIRFMWSVDMRLVSHYAPLLPHII